MSTYHQDCMRTFARYGARHGTTLSPQEYVDALSLRRIATIYLEHLDVATHNLDILHCVLGLVGEWLEFDLEMTKPTNEESVAESRKELGDLCYYTAMLESYTDGPEPPLCNLRTRDEIAAHIESLVNTIKKAMFYRHEIPPQEIARQVSTLWTAWQWIAETFFDTTLDVIKAENIEKLRKRYPSGTFSSEDAATKKDAVS